MRTLALRAGALGISIILGLASTSYAPSRRPWRFAINDARWRPPNLRRLDTDGYVVVRDFVSQGAAAWGDSVSANWMETFFAFPKTPFHALDNDAVRDARRGLRALMRRIALSNQTALVPDTLRGACPPVDPAPRARRAGTPTPSSPSCLPEVSMYFVTGEVPPHARARWPHDTAESSLYTKFDYWHQDDSWAWHDTDDEPAHFVSFYMPVLKPRAEDANLQLLPFSALPADARASLRGNASRAFLRASEHPDWARRAREETGAFVEVHSHGECSASDAVVRTHPPSTFAAYEEPKLAVGDLVILRGDVVHRAGPNRSGDFRIALSVRGFERTGAARERRDRPPCGSAARREAFESTVLRPRSLVHQAVCGSRSGGRHLLGPQRSHHDADMRRRVHATDDGSTGTGSGGDAPPGCFSPPL